MILAKNNKLSKFVEVTSIGPFFGHGVCVWPMCVAGKTAVGC